MRRCTCDRVRLGEAFDRRRDCEPCWLYHHHAEIGATWGRVGPPVPLRDGHDCGCGAPKKAKPCPPRELVPGLVDPLGSCWRDPGPWCDDPAELARHAAALQLLAAAELPEPTHDGTAGVVTCAEGVYGPLAAASLRLLRRHGCTLPAEVWTRPWAGELDRSLFAGIPDVEIVDAGIRGRSRIPRRSGLGGWSSKQHAVAHSRFRTVLFLDADCFPLGDLTPLVELAQEHGFAYWREYTDNERFERLGIDRAHAPAPIQAGQFAVDRVTCWREVLLCLWCCYHEDFLWPVGRSNWLMFGDQGGWNCAFALTRRRAHLIGPCGYHPGAGYSYQLGGRLVASHPCLSKPIRRGYPGEAEILTALASL